jgi:hypothetical protein
VPDHVPWHDRSNLSARDRVLLRSETPDRRAGVSYCGWAERLQSDQDASNIDSVNRRNGNPSRYLRVGRGGRISYFSWSKFIGAFIAFPSARG